MCLSLSYKFLFQQEYKSVFELFIYLLTDGVYLTNILQMSWLCNLYCKVLTDLHNDMP